MQPALDSLKFPILQEVKKAGREKFQKHQNPKSGQNLYFGIVGRYFFLVVSSQQNPMYECNLSHSFFWTASLERIYSANFPEIAREKKKKTCSNQSINNQSSINQSIINQSSINQY